MEKENLEVLLTEWKTLYDKAENIEQGHWTVFTILIAGFGLGLLGKNSPDYIPFKFLEVELLYWIIPLLILFVVCYEAYKLREFAVLRGYLAKLEDKIRDTCGNDSMMEYFSRYKIIYISNNNQLVTFFPIVVFITVILLLAICSLNICLVVNNSGTKSIIINWAYLIFLVFIVVSCFCAIISIKDSEIIKAKVYKLAENETPILADHYWKAAGDTTNRCKLIKKNINRIDKSLKEIIKKQETLISKDKSELTKPSESN